MLSTDTNLFVFSSVLFCSIVGGILKKSKFSLWSEFMEAALAVSLEFF